MKEEEKTIDRKTIEDLISTKRDQIVKLAKDIDDLKKDAMLLCDSKQWFIEKPEIITSRQNRKKVSEEKLIGRIHWIEEYEDGDTGQKFTLERCQTVRINGEWRII